uniref:membrane-associated tyrosine- and threonine-specific cdc2-inhibitory kinase n=1 Tax=Myxine glutinosa TaxID=7769 RepID=UPI00358DFD7D
MHSDSDSHSPHGPGTPRLAVPNFFEIPGNSFSTKRNGRTPRYVPPPTPIKSSVSSSRILPRTHRHWETPLAQAVSFREDGGELKELLNSKRVTPTGSVRTLEHSESSGSMSLPLGNDTCNESAGSATSYFYQCFEVLSPLGSGSFGDVFKVRCRADGLRYAVKRSQCKYRGERDRKRKLNEVFKHENVPQHPNLLRFYRAWEERQRLYIQTELCLCSLQQWSEGGFSSGHLSWWTGSEREAWRVLVDLLRGLSCLHALGFTHLDVKPANIFLGDDGNFRIGDFGLMVDTSQADLKDAQEGDPAYMAPEVLHGHFSTAADVYSAGLTVLEIACNLELPRSGAAWQELRRGLLPTDFISDLSPSLLSVLRSMLEPNPGLRPSATSILNLAAVRRVSFWRDLHCNVNRTAHRALTFFQIILSLLLSLWCYITQPLRRTTYCELSPSQASQTHTPTMGDLPPPFSFTSSPPLPPLPAPLRLPMFHMNFIQTDDVFEEQYIITPPICPFRMDSNSESSVTSTPRQHSPGIQFPLHSPYPSSSPNVSLIRSSMLADGEDDRQRPHNCLQLEPTNLLGSFQEAVALN